MIIVFQAGIKFYLNHFKKKKISQFKCSLNLNRERKKTDFHFKNFIRKNILQRISKIGKSFIPILL